MAAGTVTTALAAIGKKISVEFEINPLKVPGSKSYNPRIQQMLDGFAKEDPATKKKLPIEVDIPNYVAELGRAKEASELAKAVGDLTLIAFYYLLRVGEYTKKRKRNSSKQTRQFKLQDCRFFKRDEKGRLRQLPRDATDEEIMSAEMVPLKLDNQKNGWKGVCINQHWNGEDYLDGTRAVARRYCHIRQHTSDMTTFLSAYWVDGIRHDVTDEDIRASVKMAAAVLNYPELRGIPVERVDTHSLRSGGANALALAGYTETQIQKMGRWKGATFKEYISDQLHCFAAGMSKSMSQQFGFVNIAGGAYSDVTNTAVATNYNVNVVSDSEDS